MSRPLWMLSLLLVCALARAADGDGDPWESAERIRQLVGDYARQQASPGSHIEVSALDQRLRLPACAQPPQTFVTPGSTGRGALSVGVRCAGPTQWSLYVPVRISEFRQVAVLTRALAPGEVITPDAISMQERDSATLAYGYVGDPAQAIGKTLRRPLAPGAVLTPDAVAAQQVIRRGQSVNVVGRVGGIEVRAQGIAQGDAGVGERLQVQNAGSRRVVEGIVRSADTVEVSL